jgi:hypothetical protein
MENQYHSVLHMNSLVYHHVSRLPVDVGEPIRSSSPKPRSHTAALPAHANRGISFWQLRFGSDDARRGAPAAPPEERAAEVEAAAGAEEESAEPSPRPADGDGAEAERENETDDARTDGEPLDAAEEPGNAGEPEGGDEAVGGEWLDA